MHVAKANKAYKFQAHDKNVTASVFTPGYFDGTNAADIGFNSTDAFETQIQDAGGNLRTPRLRVGEAFYKRILATFNYGIYSKARDTHSVYMWNEVCHSFHHNITHTLLTNIHVL